MTTDLNTIQAAKITDARGVVGLVPLVVGLFDFCVFAPLFGAPMSGPKIRAGK